MTYIYFITHEVCYKVCYSRGMLLMRYVTHEVCYSRGMLLTGCVTNEVCHAGEEGPEEGREGAG